MSNEKEKKFWQQREELSEEGKELWDKMMGEISDIETKQKVRVKTRRQYPLTPDEVFSPAITKVDTEETKRIRLELKKLQQNSRIVIADCQEQQELYVKREEYFKANECRVATLCHTNFIHRLQRILDGLTAFERDIELTDEGTSNTLFVR